MTKTEALQILAILKAAYPSAYNGMTKEEATGTVSVWCMQFADVPVDIVLMAVQKLISSCKFPPSISEVKEKISTIHWEANEALYGWNREGLTEEGKARLQRIHDATAIYKYPRMAEPSVSQMIGGSQQLYIGAGGK